MSSKAIYQKIQRKTHLLQFIPKQILLLLDGKDKVDHKGKWLKCDYIIDLANSILSRYYFSEKANINISSEVARTWYGTFYNYYISYLQDIGFIKLYSKHWNNGKCTTYTLNKDYLSDVVRVENLNKRLINKWKAKFMLQHDTDTSCRIDKKIKAQLIEDMLYVEVAYDDALSYLEELKTDNFINDTSYHRNRICVMHITDGSLFHTEDEYGRLHTNFTTLKKSIRNRFTTIANEPVGETDIQNSQPFFLAYYLRSQKHFDLINPAEYERFVNTVENGKVYDILANQGNISRDKAKKVVYRVLFGKTNFNTSAAKLFYSLFPSISRAIACIKDFNGNHKFLAHELQRIESDIIFNKICKRVKKECRGIRIFTVHDSLFYQRRFQNKVDKIFDEELSKLKISA